MPALFALLGVIFLFLAGFDVARRWFEPGWLGLAFLALAMFWSQITSIGG